MVLFTLFLVSSVFAAVTVDNNDLVTDVSYESLSDNDHEVDVTWHVTINNDGASTENVALSLEGVDSDYDLTLSESSLNVSAGGSSDVTISGTAPVDKDSGENNVGTLKVNGISYELKTNVEDMLDVKKAKVYVNGDETSSINEDGDDIKNIMPGDEVELSFELRNLLDKHYNDGDIDGTVYVSLDDSGFGDSIDEEQDFSIDAGDNINADNKDVVVKFTVPDDAEDDEYNLQVSVESKDGSHAKYKTEWEINFAVQRDENDLRVDDVTLSPTELSCSRTTTLTVQVKNYGSSRQKHGALTIYNTELGIDENAAFDVREGTSRDNTYTYQQPITISKDVKAGRYPLSINALYDYNIFSDKEQVDLVVKDCAAPAAEPAKEDNTSAPGNNMEATTTPEASTNQVSSSAVVKTIEDDYTKQDFLIAVMFVMMILVFAIVVMLLMVLFKK